MLGLLNLHKPAGMTSRDVVDHVQQIVWPVKVGHAGTLDPLATGVLVVCVGSATRLIAFVQQMPKTYQATFELGCRSDTDDSEGQLDRLPSAPQPTLDMIQSALPRFTGEIQQRPPAYSALKIRGQPAYKRARRGEQVALQPRPVHVARLAIRHFDYPRLELDIECGSGTYVRAIGRDLAESLGTGAIMTALVRTAIGCFRLEDAAALEAVTAESLNQLLQPPARALDGRPTLRLDKPQLQRIIQGQFLRRVNHGYQGPVCALDELGQMVAVLQPHGHDDLRPCVVLPH